jgi:hypothetical protein
VSDDLSSGQPKEKNKLSPKKRTNEAILWGEDIIHTYSQIYVGREKQNIKISISINDNPSNSLNLASSSY